jgi:hypothetical protein
MDYKELLKIANATGIAAEKIVHWHQAESPFFISKNPGRPKGKLKRPRGTLSIGDARRRYDLSTDQIRAWRNEGMPSLTLGTLIAIRENDLKKWMKKHGLGG